MTHLGDTYSWVGKPGNRPEEQLQFNGISGDGIQAFSQEQWNALKKTTRLRLWFTYKKTVDQKNGQPNNKNIHYISRRSADQFLQTHKDSLPAYISLKAAKKMIFSGKIIELAKALATVVDRPIISSYETPLNEAEHQKNDNPQATKNSSLSDKLYKLYSELLQINSDSTRDDAKNMQEAAKGMLEKAAKGMLDLLHQAPLREVPARQVLAHILAISTDPEIKNIAIAIDQENYLQAAQLLMNRKYTIIGHLNEFNREQEEKRAREGLLPPLRATSIPISQKVAALSPASQELVAKFKQSGLAHIPAGLSDYAILKRIQMLINNETLTSDHCSDLQKVRSLIENEKKRIDALNAGKKEPPIARVEIQFNKPENQDFQPIQLSYSM